MMGTNACYSCGKLGHMVMDCLNKKSKEQGKGKVKPNGPSERFQGGKDFSHTRLSVQGKTPLVKSPVRILN